MGSDRDFAVLDDKNYDIWSYRMEMRLVKLDLYDVVDGSTVAPNTGPGHTAMLKFRKRQRLARAELVAYVSDSQIVHTKFDDPHDIWMRLKTVHNARGFGTRMSLRRRLHKMKYDDFLEPTMRAWITAVQDIVQRIRDLEGEVPDEDVIVILTESLPQSYDSLIVSLDGIPESELSLDLVIGRLIKEEARQNSPEPPSSSALTARAPATVPRVKRDVKDITCWRCHNKGHYESNCPLPLPTSESSPSTSAKPTGRMF